MCNWTVLYAQIDISNHEEIAKDPEPWRSWSFMELNTNDKGLSFLQEPKRFVSMKKQQWYRKKVVFSSIKDIYIACRAELDRKCSKIKYILHELLELIFDCISNRQTLWVLQQQWWWETEYTFLEGKLTSFTIVSNSSRLHLRYKGSERIPNQWKRSIERSLKTNKNEKKPYVEKINTNKPSSWYAHCTLVYRDVLNPMEMHCGKYCRETFADPVKDEVNNINAKIL